MKVSDLFGKRPKRPNPVAKFSKKSGSGTHKSVKDYNRNDKHKKDLRRVQEGKATKQTVWVIAHTGSKVILGKRSPTSNNPNLWNFFGGGVSPSETPLETAAREFYEETGCEISPSQLKKISTIGSATYYTLRISPSQLQTTSEISAIKKYKITDLPNNLHSKTEDFFDSLIEML